MSLDLATVTARGRTYAVSSSPETIYGTKKPGIGKNKRTAKFIGGGAAAGSVIGPLRAAERVHSSAGLWAEAPAPAHKP